ncbi:gluconate transport inducer 1/Pac2, partial [Piptocephalis cylindrospora]
MSSSKHTGPTPLSSPSYHGFLSSLFDAQILFTAAIMGTIPILTRRLTSPSLAPRSGAIYVYDEEVARIQRWTDGRAWSPARSISSPFQRYLELE